MRQCGSVRLYYHETKSFRRRRFGKSGQRLMLVARNGVGYEHLDIDACTRGGVMIAITPEARSRNISSIRKCSIIPELKNLQLRRYNTRPIPSRLLFHPIFRDVGYRTSAGFQFQALVSGTYHRRISSTARSPYLSAFD
ncbi:MAG: hypothetical protein KJ674_05890 [Nanoarchaeota archaeon]|nr:hypothetical protein [Nanoarchaeota archaeon]